MSKRGRAEAESVAVGYREEEGSVIGTECVCVGHGRAFHFASGPQNMRAGFLSRWIGRRSSNGAKWVAGISSTQSSRARSRSLCSRAARRS